jgi:hypothetical protein
MGNAISTLAANADLDTSIFSAGVQYIKQKSRQISDEIMAQARSLKLANDDLANAVARSIERNQQIMEAAAKKAFITEQRNIAMFGTADGKPVESVGQAMLREKNRLRDLRAGILGATAATEDGNLITADTSIQVDGHVATIDAPAA